MADERVKKSAEQGNILELKEVWLPFCSQLLSKTLTFLPYLEVA